MREVNFEQPSVTNFSVYEFGNGQGPSVTITAAIHGDEQTAVHTAFLLIKSFGEITVNGKIKVIPICNPASYRNRTRWSPFDNVDMNRVFPGSAEGSPTMQLANALWKETRDAEYIIDLHCCGAGGSTYTLALYEEYPDLRELAEALGIPVVIQSGGTRGQFFVESCNAGQKAMIIELPGGQPGGTIDLMAAEDCSKSVQNYLRHLGLIEGEISSSPVTFFGKITTLTAPKPGLFLPSAKPGVTYDQGELLGTFEGTPLTAPFAGILTTLSLPRYCFSGEHLAGIAPLERK